jgi:hypothetical protein
MNRETAIEILKDYQEWRRFDGALPDSPPMPDPFIVGKAIDFAIEYLSGKATKPEKEYYGG